MFSNEMDMLVNTVGITETNYRSTMFSPAAAVALTAGTMLLPLAFLAISVRVTAHPGKPAWL